MLKRVIALLAALAAAFMLMGAATEASAHYRHSGCCGGPIPTTYVYRTHHKVTHVTRYRDVSRTRYVYRPHHIVHITPSPTIIYIHSVTRIHHHTVSIVRPYHTHATEYLPPRRIVTYSVSNTYDCRCSRRHCR